MKIELMQCPFCGALPHIQLPFEPKKVENIIAVYCIKCGTQGPMSVTHKAIELWNTRF